MELGSVKLLRLSQKANALLSILTTLIGISTSSRLLQYENAVIIFMSANDIYELQRTYEDKLRDKLGIKKDEN